MSFQAIRSVLTHRPTNDPLEQLLLLVIANYCNASSEGAFPSIPRLARDTCLSERTVYRLTRRLQAKGILLVVPGGGRHHANTYQLEVEKPCPIVRVLPWRPGQTLPATAESKPCLLDRETLTASQGILK